MMLMVKGSAKINGRELNQKNKKNYYLTIKRKKSTYDGLNIFFNEAQYCLKTILNMTSNSFVFPGSARVVSDV